MLKIYPAIFHKEDNSFWVEFSDLGGCQSCGNSLE
ncbi:type II toxin-antitoxin system HicB family antitoxin [Anaerovorax odorimutans]|nr:type II toxin-antitoxin system HicB family antitoxin [Anaerovorax odorimutans]